MLIRSLVINLRLHLEPGKYQGKKIERKRIRKKNLVEIKNRFKLNKLILYVLFKLILFVSLYYIRTKKFKNMKNFGEF